MGQNHTALVGAAHMYHPRAALASLPLTGDFYRLCGGRESPTDSTRPLNLQLTKTDETLTRVNMCTPHIETSSFTESVLGKMKACKENILSEIVYVFPQNKNETFSAGKN